MEQQVIEYSVTDAAIAKMEDLYMSLTVSDLDDEEGFNAVHDGRMVVKGKRIEVEKKRKGYKADSLAYGRKIDAEAKRIFGLLKPIEDHLQGQENIITKEKERIKAEEEAKEKAKIENRVSELFALGVNVLFFDLAMLPDNEYAEKLQSAKVAYNAEQLRIDEEEKRLEEEKLELARLREKEEADRRLEAERLEKLAEAQKVEAKRLEKIQTDIDAKEKALKDEQDKLEAEKKAEQDNRDKAEFERKAKEDAKIQADKDAAEKILREKKEAADRVIAEEAEKKRQAVAEETERKRQIEIAPDREKLLDLAMTIRQIVSPPAIKNEITKEIVSITLHELLSIADNLVSQAEKL